MKIITIAAPKGGTGKTTITALLAARAACESARVAMIDLNADQGNLTQWWISRGQPMNPRLIADVADLIEDVEILRNDGFEWIFVDTPPIDLELIETAVMVADVVIVPVRPSILDVGAIEAIGEICKERQKPFAFLLNAVDVQKLKKIVDATAAELLEEGPLLATRISYRAPYVNAMTAGRTGPEINKDVKPEIDGLWAELKRMVDASVGAPAVKGRAAND